MVSFHDIPSHSISHLIQPDEQCAICLGKLEDDLLGHYTDSDCKVHAMHKLCIQPWLEKNKTCPVCRARAYIKYPSDPSSNNAQFLELFLGGGLPISISISLVIIQIAFRAGIIQDTTEDRSIITPLSFFSISAVIAFYITKRLHNPTPNVI